MSKTKKSDKTDPKKEFNTFRFTDYKVYHESKKWYQEVLQLRGVLEATALWNPLKGNLHSLVMNIAAASTKLPMDAKRYLGNGITAINKAVACLDIACDEGAIDPDEFSVFTEGFKGMVIQLKSFIKALGAARPPKGEQTPETQAGADSVTA
ncbi:MAG: hypothetical protein Q8O95_02970 [bacterium]|nr:hypothetical protein [bacterium]